MKFYKRYYSDSLTYNCGAVKLLKTQPAYKGESQYETKLWKYPIGVSGPNIYPAGWYLEFILMNYLSLLWRAGGGRPTHLITSSVSYRVIESSQASAGHQHDWGDLVNWSGNTPLICLSVYWGLNLPFWWLVAITMPGSVTWSGVTTSNVFQSICSDCYSRQIYIQGGIVSSLSPARLQLLPIFYNCGLILLQLNLCLSMLQ